MLLLVENQGQMKTKSGLLGLNGINYCKWVDSIPFWINLNHGAAVICQKTAKSENHYIKPAVLDLKTRALYRTLVKNKMSLKLSEKLVRSKQKSNRMPESKDMNFSLDLGSYYS